MNRAVTFVAALAVAAPLFAADPKPIATPSTQPAQGDSPLVAAAKRANRLGKKPAMVITNDTLLTSGGHFTTTQKQEPISTPTFVATTQPPQPQRVAAPPSAAEKKQKEAEEARQKVIRQLQAQYEGETLEADHDPAKQEQQMQQVQKAPEKKP